MNNIRGLLKNLYLFPNYSVHANKVLLEMVVEDGLGCFFGYLTNQYVTSRSTDFRGYQLYQ
jgi:hypothetical protein